MLPFQLLRRAERAVSPPSDPILHHPAVDYHVRYAADSVFRDDLLGHHYAPGTEA
ncbi:hypothetical protein E4U43_004335, partial [Claviceps pusilla]